MNFTIGKLSLQPTQSDIYGLSEAKRKQILSEGVIPLNALAKRQNHSSAVSRYLMFISQTEEVKLEDITLKILWYLLENWAI